MPIEPKHDFTRHVKTNLDNHKHYFSTVKSIEAYGVLTRLTGLILEAVGCRAPVGSHCIVQSQHDDTTIEAEVVGFADDKLYLMSTESVTGLSPGDTVIPIASIAKAHVSDEYLGRVVDGVGKPLDDLSEIFAPETYPLVAEPMNPMKRAKITEPLDVGVRSINGLLTIAKGQRIGLFAGSGVGKSVLLGMMTKYTKADVVVLGLIGERGREVKEFIEDNLGEAGMLRSVVVASPADTSPIMRLHAANYATALAEYFRDQGKSVLLLMDSLTRYAQAQREIALAVGEPPASKGYPPSVFTKLPKLVERAGMGPVGKGSITAFYTVLSEGDDMQDPIVDASRAILDGHIVLSRRLADSGVFPAIDLEASISRVMVNVVNEPHMMAYRQFKALHAKYEENRDLINIGAYAMGSDPLIDQSINMMPHFKNYMTQTIDEAATFEQSVQDLQGLFQNVSAETS
jgi:flagellum-specific ATP synthase